MTDEEIAQVKIDAIQSAVWLVRDVYDHGRENTDFHKGFMKALETVESLTNHMRGNNDN